ncbi:MAG: hypothetical protein IPL79_00095 [Myxococcales bacterium]|nr:hypothetical protein [Myxococcales bacterium]
MRAAFVVVMVLHGLIHLLGFAKAFGLAEVSQLTQPVGKALGAGWLVACGLLLAAALLVALAKSNWWIAGVVAVVVSQALIVSSWQDAKFGTIANLIILVAVVLGYSAARFHGRFASDVQAALRQAPAVPAAPLTEADMQHLPELVKQYVRYAGAVGKPKVHNFKIAFTGKLRKDAASPWMPFTSEQYNFMQVPTRLFFMKAVMKHLPVAGYHRFVNGAAFMDIRLLSLVRVQYLDGAAMGVAETVTFFNDMACMAPATLIDPRITWLAVEGNKVKASFTNNGITVSAWLHFDAQGALVNFTSEDRYAADAGKQLPWSTPLTAYREIGGHRLASSAEAIYSYPQGDLVYGTFALTSVAYNVR